MTDHSRTKLQTSEELQAHKALSRDKRRYVKIKFDGQSCVVESRDASDMAEGCEGAVITDVWMTEAEFEALPEFGGW